MSEHKLSFKEYLESKEQLKKALNNTPEQLCEYTVNKYCKLAVGETKEDKQYIPLKPKQKILVDWVYHDLYNPTVRSIQFKGVNKVNEEDTFSTSWKGTKLQNWLAKHTENSQTLF